MAEVLLTSENTIKATTNISDNVSSKYILSALREAQEVSLKGIIGIPMLERLKSLVEDKRINDAENERYKNLIGKCQYYLAYMTIVELINRVSYKIGNAGLVKASDENMQVASFEEIVANKDFYQGKADYFRLELQQYILDDMADYPEVNEVVFRRLRSNLSSAASCGLFLGGARGKRRVR
jgi:hypothetical protein